MNVDAVCDYQRETIKSLDNFSALFLEFVIRNCVAICSFEKQCLEIII